MSYAFDDEDVQTWRPSEPVPTRVALHRGQIRAHNAAFERLIFQYVLDMPMPPERFVCTAAQARSNCLPGSLEDIGRAVSSRMRKDFRGSQLIRKMCVPPFQHTPALMIELIQYCEQDVRAMRAISQAMRPLSAEELLDYHINERVNDRGVMLDLPLTQSHSPPYGSDDDPCAQAQFKWLKYRPDLSCRLGCIDDSCTHCQVFWHWRKASHRHLGIGHMAPPWRPTPNGASATVFQLPSCRWLHGSNHRQRRSP
jgi:hypothetical protein